MSSGQEASEDMGDYCLPRLISAYMRLVLHDGSCLVRMCALQLLTRLELSRGFQFGLCLLAEPHRPLQGLKARSCPVLCCSILPARQEHVLYEGLQSQNLPVIVLGQPLTGPFCVDSEVRVDNSSHEAFTVISLEVQDYPGGHLA